MKYLIAAWAIFLALVFPPMASAHPFVDRVADRVTNAVPAPDLAWDVAQAEIYWANRGLTWTCYLSDVFWADSVHNANPQDGSDEIKALGYIGACGIVLRKLRYPQMTPWTDQERFTLIVHEMGHNVGLQHDDPRYSVMSGSNFNLVSPEAAIPSTEPEAADFDESQLLGEPVRKKSCKKYKKIKKRKKCQRGLRRSR